ncbi:hypothetical protein SEPCBS57363_005897 [Sporothrix epigloea]|uniref:THUMP domain-containing protein n=1 Tax=Sporothrix epigloea TaxID=1892477 RepID=A0ABP0E028_9PEZI
MAESNKRKNPSGAVPSAKKKKGGNNGKWSTPHQKVRALQLERGSVEPGEVGIWVTCARNMEGRAAREMMELFNKYAKEMYGIADPAEAGGDADGAGDADEIEDAVQREIALLKAPQKNDKSYFTHIRLNIECLLFSKTIAPIDPVAMAHRISVDIKSKAEAASLATEEAIANGVAAPVAREFRYLNRLTPIAASGRANEKGVREVGRKVLSPWFKLAPQSVTAAEDEPDKEKTGEIPRTAHGATLGSDAINGDEKPSYTFAIRPSFRHHHELERREVIDLVAGLIDQEHHKVDLENPDKVILIEIFRYTCGMSVVDGDWNELRKYNLSELYNLQFKSGNGHTVKAVTGAAAKASEADGETGVDRIHGSEK